MKNISSILLMWLFKKIVSGWNFVRALQKVRNGILRLGIATWNQQYRQDKATQT